MTLEYPIVIVPLGAEDGGGYFAFAPDLPGCVSDGATPEEAAVSVQDAVREWLAAQTDRGAKVPVPGDANRRALEREDKIYAAMEAALASRKGADEKIQKLERQLAELIALTRDELGRPRVTMADPRLEIGREVRIKH
jgi:antitoxin HicB